MGLLSGSRETYADMLLSGIYTLVTMMQKNTKKVWMIIRWVSSSHVPMVVDGVKYAIIIEQ